MVIRFGVESLSVSIGNIHIVLIFGILAFFEVNWGGIMARKPTYEELKQRVMALEKETAKRIQAEKALRKEEQERKTILDSLTEHIVYHDTEHKVLWANRAAGESVDLAPEKLVGRYCYEVWQQRTKPCPNCPVEKAIESGQPQETEITTPDGRVWLIQGNPIRNENGNITGGVETTLEITKRKQTEEALRESEGKISAMLQSLGDHISMMDKDLNIIWANETAKKVFGNGIIGKKCYEVYHRRKEPCEPYPCLTLKAFQDENVHEHDTQVIDKDGKIMFFHCTANVALKDRRGNPTAVIEISRDITEHMQAEEEKKKLEARLNHAQKMESLGRLAGGVAHNFRNILQGIMANSQFLQMEYSKDKQLQAILRDINESVRSGADLIDSMLKFSRQAAEIKLIPLDLKDVLDETHKIMSNTFDTKIKIVTNIEGQLPIKGDYETLYQVFMNLCNNARESMPDGGVLMIEARKDKQKVVAAISDTGCGIDEETLKNIFDPFYTTKDVGEGTGLGLSLTHGIIKEHHGTISVSSRLGHGTVLKVSFPVAEEIDLIESEPPLKIRRGKGEKILIVDDEPKVLKSLGNMLEAIGYDVDLARNGDQAIKHYKEYKPDLVLLDWKMPNMDGATCAKKILDNDITARIIITTGYQETAINRIDVGLRDRLKAVILKPYDVSKLNEVILKALES